MIRAVLVFCVLGVASCMLGSCKGKSSFTTQVGEHTVVIIKTSSLLSKGHSHATMQGSELEHECRDLKVSLRNEVLMVNDKKYLIPKKDDFIRVIDSRVEIKGQPAKLEAAGDTMPMKAYVTVEQMIQVGRKIVIEGPSPCTSFAVVFEDDGDTGYFYGLDTSLGDNSIVDALHIYDVSEVADKDIPSTIQIVWSADGLKAALLINRYPHAVFDFQAKRGYCRHGFPPPFQSIKWTEHGHEWDDRAMDLFR